MQNIDYSIQNPKESIIWIDIVTAPDVLFFSSIIKKLETLKIPLIVTARKYSEVPELCEKYKIKAIYIDNFYGKNTFTKIVSLIVRIIQLFLFINKNKNVALSFAYVSRPAAIVSYLLKIKHITSYDYEEAEVGIVNKLSSIVYLPEEISNQTIIEKGLLLKKVKRYPGLKEAVYCWDFVPNISELQNIGIDKERIFFILRMSSKYANYGIGKIDFDLELIEYLLCNKDLQLIVLPRYLDQFRVINELAEKNNNLFLLKEHINGQNMVYFADAVISGGGSMIREAVYLGTPAYDIFNGRLGSVEKSLINDGNIVKINGVQEFFKISLKKKTILKENVSEPSSTFRYFISQILQIHSELKN